MTVTLEDPNEAAATSRPGLPTAVLQDPQALRRYALSAVEDGRLEDAVELLSASLRLDGENHAAISDLAKTLGRLNRQEEALEFHRIALAMAPRNAEFHLLLGNALAAAGEVDEASECLHRAVKLAPQSPATHGNLGYFHQMRGDLDRAISCYRKALRLPPESADVMSNLGACLLTTGKCEEAIELLTRAIAKFPRCAKAISNLAAAYTAMGRTKDAVAKAWQALEIEPRSSATLNNLGNALKAEGDYEQAIRCFGMALELSPACETTCNNLGTTLSEVGRSKEAVDAIRHAHSLKPQSAAIFSNYLLTLNYLPGVSREKILAEHKRFDETLARSLTDESEPHRNRAEPERKLRVGYVSADLREHPVANFVEPMLASHARDAFEIYCYANQRTSDATTERFRKIAHQWRQVDRMTDAEMAEQIRRDKIDILVDLSGHTAGNRMLVFARKPAPVQVAMIGYMQTTGLSGMDYRITDSSLDPVGTSEEFSTETLVRIPSGAATFTPPVTCPDVNELPALKNGFVTFASFNNLAKITDGAVTAWAEILRQVPNSRLLVVGRAAKSLEASLITAGIETDRLELLERQPMAEYLALHQRVDVMLDTFPYNGGTTTLIAAWMGVPFVTLAGASPVARAGINLLRGLGLAELAADDPTGYVAGAVAAGSDLPRLAEWRGQLREKLRPMLGNGVAFTREIEAAYRTMWRDWCAQQPAKK